MHDQRYGVHERRPIRSRNELPPQSRQNEMTEWAKAGKFPQPEPTAPHFVPDAQLAPDFRADVRWSPFSRRYIVVTVAVDRRPMAVAALPHQAPPRPIPVPVIAHEIAPEPRPQRQALPESYRAQAKAHRAQQAAGAVARQAARRVYADTQKFKAETAAIVAAAVKEMLK